MFFYKNYGHLQRREDAVLIIQGNKEIKIKSYNLLYGKSLKYILFTFIIIFFPLCCLSFDDSWSQNTDDWQQADKHWGLMSSGGDGDAVDNQEMFDIVDTYVKTIFSHTTEHCY